MTRDTSGSSVSDTCPIVKVCKPPDNLVLQFLQRQSCIFIENEEEAEEKKMDKRARLRVQKKKPIKRRGMKVFIKKVFDYLKSDTFMYAPLLSPLPSHAFNALPASPAKELEFQKPVKEKQCFGKQVGEYLKSDDYMYDPLLHLPHSSKEPLHDYGMTMDDSTRSLTMKVNQQNDHLGNTNQSSESPVDQTDLSDQHKHTETVKHTVYQICRSSAAPRIVTLNSQLRAHT
ncbi:hypothetical protein VNO80_22192 [Phaseolus coccineus]|uniref:Uncharacterized protein n=1 Tax=Phaseolus coccineus TaxID=3886 RepID=A0AAN9M3N5_PHACN